MIFLDLFLHHQLMILLVEPIRGTIRFGTKLEINRAEVVGKRCLPLRRRRARAIPMRPVMVVATAAADTHRRQNLRGAVQRFILSAVLEYRCGDFCL